MYFETILSLLFLLSKVAEANLQCHCNTQECQDQNVQYCIARNFCYTEVQFLPGHHQTTLGCIDEATPLMCDRNLQGSGLRFLNPSPQLKLTCCRSNMCNQYFRGKPLNNIGSEKNSNNGIVPTKETEPARPIKPLTSTRIPISVHIPKIVDDPQPRDRTLNFNPLIVAIPTAAGCLLLCFIIIVIFFTKQRCLSKNGVTTGSESDSGSSEFRDKCIDPSVCRPPIHTVFYSPYTKLARDPIGGSRHPC